MSTQDQFDAGAFRKALGTFTTGVTVVTTFSEEVGDVGLTANSFNSVSLDPPMVLWSLAKSAGSLAVFKSSQYFAVHILSEEQEDLSNQFARRGIDKFAGVSIQRGPEGTPLLEHCAARFVCKTVYQYDGGDHIIFVGEVSDFARWEKLPLLFHSGQYSHIRKPQLASRESCDNEVPDDSLGYLLRASYQQLIQPLTLELAKRDLVIAQHYLLANAAIYKNKTMMELLDTQSVTGSIPSSEEIETLFERGFINEIDGCIQLTPKGFNLRIELVAIYKAIESDVLNSLNASTAQSLKIILRQFIDCLEIGK